MGTCYYGVTLPETGKYDAVNEPLSLKAFS
ncbi:hypothetical protein CCP4SC76_1700003 [Gammaproteobacteria bacterium]